MSLEGKVALVAGATFYVTGRTTRERRSEYDRPETIEETAREVILLGPPAMAMRLACRFYQ